MTSKESKEIQKEGQGSASKMHDFCDCYRLRRQDSRAANRGGFPIWTHLSRFFLFVLFNAHSSTPTAVFLTSREETQTMVRVLKPRPRQTLDLPGKGESVPICPFLYYFVLFGTLVTRIAATSNCTSLATAIATQKNHCDSEKHL